MTTMMMSLIQMKEALKMLLVVLMKCHLQRRLLNFSKGIYFDKTANATA